jgi:hypothetical protein
MDLEALFHLYKYFGDVHSEWIVTKVVLLFLTRKKKKEIPIKSGTTLFQSNYIYDQVYTPYN